MQVQILIVLATIQASRPPPIVAAPPAIAASQPARSQPMFPSSQPPERRDVIGGSQPNAMEWDANTASQIPFASTQVLPGPHGGRPSIVKKKTTKKRVGGF